MSSNSNNSIFADPHGRRRRFLQVTIVVIALLLVSASAYFIASLLVAPELRLPQQVRGYRTPLKAFKDPGLLASTEDWHHFLETANPLPFPKNSQHEGGISAFVSSVATPSQKNQEQHLLEYSSFPIRLGYAVDWDPQSISSLKQHADFLTHVATDWFHIVGVEGRLVESPSEEIRSCCVRKNLGLLPILRNIDGTTWQPEAIEGLFKSSTEEQDLFFSNLIKRLPPGAIGLLLDWNELDPSYRTELNQLLIRFGKKLHESHYEFWISISTEKAEKIFDLQALSEVADRFVLSLDDENSEPDEPGPLAEQDWVEEQLKEIIRYGKAEQWVAGLGCFGLDWNETKGTVETLSFVDVMARANLALAEHVSVEAPHFSPSFHYLSGLNEKEEHEIWFLDAITFFNQLHTISHYPIGGIALDRLGEEDPDIWKALKFISKMKTEDRHEPTTEELEAFETLSLKNEVASIGRGDFLSVGDEPSKGWRDITLEPTEFMSSLYEEFPRPACVYHQGAAPLHQVALTFDDGPDPTWTPRILRILKEKKVPAAFFVVGSQAQQFPDLLVQILEEGHELGNHTYTHQNLAAASDEQISLELNATTRLIESITGHSTSLFRPPYNSDATPSTPGELRALGIASDLGYLTVGESIDTSDWECPGVETILNNIKEERVDGGSVILMHDAGGNRSQTVAALPLIIDYLHARGDEIVPLGRFIELPRDVLMPPLRHGDVTVAMRYIYGSFATLRFIEMAAWTLLIITTLLSLLFILFFIACALLHRRREKREVSSHLQYNSSLPPLSVIVAAYNEECVIDSTIEHLLASSYEAPIELIIVDDGSHDKTSEKVMRWVNEHSTSQRSIILLQQPNTGKASALNDAIASSSHEYIVTLDADTMVSSEALRFLIQPLSNPEVGAVSGHIRVGNFRHWLGRFQQIEYEFSFEINRRAQDLLNCITVVPGALSAFRRKALLDAGPLNTETLAEDTDLTLQLHRYGWKVTYAPLAIADTEAPQNIRALFSQRFRWAFGTLQCVWKHRSLILSPGSGWLGWLALPSIWIFQIGIIAITPILDLLVIFSIYLGRGKAIYPYFILSLLIDTVIAGLSAHLAKRSFLSAWRALPMRFLYRPVLGYVVWKSLFKAAEGSWVRWKKLERTAAAIKEKEVNPHISY
jgi:cellulose synthase/poly-beta-1,6-N-acetylglucosamine synthase-like glycosyltransferase/peptidoglycan/xylan/chitin deacetylase (PgdA/CDA1 family)/spore germination protein YaaH